MLKCTVRSLLRENACLIYGEKNLKIELGESFIALSSDPAKKYSFLAPIVEKRLDENISGIVLEIDSRRIGPISDHDTVQLYKYNLPVAERIVIGLIDENHIGIPSGNWTATLKPLLLGKMFDYGDLINTAMDFEVDGKNNIFLIRGMLLESYSNPPISVGANTIIEIKKLTREEYQQTKNELEQRKISRSDEYLGYSEEMNKELIAQLKSGDFEKASEIFHFKSLSGKSLNSLIEGVFTGFNNYKEHISDDGMTFTCSRIYVIKDEGLPSQILEYQLASFEQQGSVIINVYTTSMERSTEIAKNLINDIDKQYLSLKKRPLITGFCPECGEKVPLGSFDGDFIICENCGKDIRLN
jgi:hypothetical protein